MENIDSPIRLYINKKLMIAGMPYAELLFPFLGPTFNPSEPYSKATHKYLFDKKYFSLVDDVRQSDYYLLPYDYWHLKNKKSDLLNRMFADAQSHNKPILIDASGDVSGKIDVSNSVILRLNQYRFDLPENEITVPFPCEDLLETYCDNKISVREKGGMPSVGFVGWGKLPTKQRYRTLLKEIPIRLAGLVDERYGVYRKGVFWREDALKVLISSKKIKTNFLIRDSYSGHVRTLAGDPTKNRLEFVSNILNSDYNLVVKGDANAAARFYEILSLGRIPVLLDTACVLPLEKEINYREFCLIVDYRKTKKLPEIINEFHQKISPADFIAMQKKTRYIFSHFLRRDAFSKYLSIALKQKLTEIAK